MNQSATEGEYDSEDEIKKYFDIVKSSASPYIFSSEINERLWEFIGKGLKRAKKEDKSSSRTLEIEDNCRLLGEELSKEAVNIKHSKINPIPIGVLNHILNFLCPGLWPFC